MIDTPQGRYTRTFDPVNQVVSLISADGQTLQWVRDPLGRRKVLIHPDTGRTTYIYNAVGNVTSLVNPLLERTTFSYDAAGREIEQVAANETRTSTIYGAAGHITRVAHLDDSSSVVDQFDYGYDAAGRRTQVQEFSGDRVTWTYDPTSQLLSEARSGANSYRTTYAYDATGNRLVEETLVDGPTTSTYDAANRLQRSESFSGITTYTYDAAGNRRSMEEPSGNLTTYTWNGQNQLVQVELPNEEVVTYTWSPVNKDAEERVVTRDDGTEVQQLLWDNNNVLRETDGVGTVEAEYTYQPQPYGDLVSDRRDGESNFYRFDALGSTTGLTDGSGTPTDTYRYSAFGKPVEETGTSDTPYKWIGQQGYRQDDASGLYNLRARDYDPQTGQFTSQDPLGLAAGDSNFYRYVGNNAVNTTDPSGNDDQAQIVNQNGTLTLHNSQHVPVDVLIGTMLGGTTGNMVSRQITVNGQAVIYCLPYGRVNEAVRTDQAATPPEWDAWFRSQGEPCNARTGLPITPTRPSPSSSCQVPAKKKCAPEYYTVQIDPSWCNSLLGEKPTLIRIYYDKQTGPDWDIQRLELETAAKKLQAMRNLMEVRQSISEGIVVGEYIVRSTFDAADTADAAICFVQNPSLTTGSEVAMASLPFFVFMGRRTTALGGPVWGFWDSLPKVNRRGRTYANINGRLYTQHAIERMTPPGFGTAAGGSAGRGVPSCVVEDVINNGSISEVRIVGSTTRVSINLENVEVVLEDGIVITVITH